MTRVPAGRLFRNIQPAPSQGNAQTLRIGYLIGLGDKAQPTSASSPFEGAVRVCIREFAGPLAPLARAECIGCAFGVKGARFMSGCGAGAFS